MLRHTIKSVLLRPIFLGVVLSIPGQLFATQRVVVGELITSTS